MRHSRNSKYKYRNVSKLMKEALEYASKGEEEEWIVPEHKCH